MELTAAQKKQLLLKCKKSFAFFCENFCKVKHPNAGTIPFKLFKYQKKSIRIFRQSKRVIYRKCRQSGISTLTGAYALWVAMFFPGRNVLIVSKRDEDAIAYLDRNVKFVYQELPHWMHEIFGDPRSASTREYEPPKAYNEHKIEFFQGSAIKSLTSSKDTLRSNSASLVIIDEAAFIAEMQAMWTAGQPTLMHGGRVVVISTTNGKGNWYHNTWEDGIAGANDFTTIEIPWWHMDWEIEFADDIDGSKVRIAPCDGIRKTTTKEEKLRYGEWWSPWLEQQYRELQEKGEAWKFNQEILMEFIGAGNTVLNQEALLLLEKQVDNKYKIRTKPVIYANHTASIANVMLDFQQRLYIWELPVRRTPDVVDNGKVIRAGNPGHRYVLGADISSGEATDFSTICVVDATTKRQVAELQIKCEASEFAKMIDYLGRLYNDALAVVENNGIGKPVAQDLRSVYYYPNLFHRRLPSGKKDKKVGFPTTTASKPEIIKLMTDYMGVPEVDGGVLFRSARLSKEANAYIHLGTNRFGNEPGTNNNDDLMMAAGLALVGILEAMQSPDGLIPTSSKHVDMHFEEKIDTTMDDILKSGGHELMYPIAMRDDPTPTMTADQEIKAFMAQMGGGITLEQQKKQMAPSRPKVIYFPN